MGLNNESYHFKHELAIVIPTKGRKTLRRCLESLKPRNQGGYGAERIVVYDSYGPMTNVPQDYYTKEEVKTLCDEYHCDFEEFDAGYHNWGYNQLAYAYEHCVRWSEYIMNIGDDDVMVEGIIPRIVDIVRMNGIQPYMFQAELHPSPHRGNTEPVILWNDSDRSIVRQCVTGQNLVVPNISYLMGDMVDDFEFIRSTIARWHGLVEWVPLVTCRCY